MTGKLFDSKVGPLSVIVTAPDQMTIHGQPFRLNRVDYAGFGLRVTKQRGEWFATGGPYLSRADGNYKQAVPHTASRLVVTEARRVAALAAEDADWLLEGEAGSFDALVGEQRDNIGDAQARIAGILVDRDEFLAKRKAERDAAYESERRAEELASD